MPSYKQHIEQAEHNGELLRILGSLNKQTDFSDWYVTVVFYAALHYFEAMLFALKPTVQFGTLSAKVEHSGSLGRLYPKQSDHQLRRKFMETDFPNVYTPYRSLYEMSRMARYDCHASRSYNWVLAETYLHSVKVACGVIDM